MAGVRAGRDTRRPFTLVHLVHTHRAALDRTHAARHVGFLVAQRLVHKRARLVRAGHHTVAATDTNVFIHQHNAVRALERGASGTDIHTGRLGAVLAHHGQRLGLAGAHFLDFDLANPLR